MEKASQELKQKLEARLGHEICPFTIEIKTDDDYGPIINFFTTTEYFCDVNQRIIAEAPYKGARMTPCSMEYARTCPLYKQRMQETTFKKPE